MAKYVSDSLYVCSIYPGKLAPFVANVGPDPKPSKGRRTVWQVKPIKDRYAKKPAERYYVMEFTDSFENVPNPMASLGGIMPQSPSPVACEQLVNNALNFWCGNMPGFAPGHTPGIMQITNSTPTEDEMSRLIRMQTLYFEDLFQLGEKASRENNWQAITQEMRDACLWLGYQRNWAAPEKSSENVPCPECFQLVNPRQRICHHCKSTLVAEDDRPSLFPKPQPATVSA